MHESDPGDVEGKEKHVVYVLGASAYRGSTRFQHADWHFNSPRRRVLSKEVRYEEPLKPDTPEEIAQLPVAEEPPEFC